MELLLNSSPCTSGLTLLLLKQLPRIFVVWASASTRSAVLSVVVSLSPPPTSLASVFSFLPLVDSLVHPNPHHNLRTNRSVTATVSCASTCDESDRVPPLLRFLFVFLCRGTEANREIKKERVREGVKERRQSVREKTKSCKMDILHANRVQVQKMVSRGVARTNRIFELASASYRICKCWAYPNTTKCTVWNPFWGERVQMFYSQNFTVATPLCESCRLDYAVYNLFIYLSHFHFHLEFNLSIYLRICLPTSLPSSPVPHASLNTHSFPPPSFPLCLPACLPPSPHLSMQFLPPINVGDALVTVGGKNVYGLSLTTLRTIVPGPAGSSVSLGFQSEIGTRVEAPLRRTTGMF